MTIREILPSLRLNCWIVFDAGVEKIAEAVEESRENLRNEVCRVYGAGVAALVEISEPAAVEYVSPGWGYPERVVVTW